MKILPNNPDPIPPEPRSLRVEPAGQAEPAKPGVDWNEQMKGFLQEFAVHAMEDVHVLEQKLEQVQARQADQLIQNSRAIARLAEEMNDLRKVLADLKIPAPSPAVLTPPPDPMIPDALSSITREISKLGAELAALRKTVGEIKFSEPNREPAPAPKTVKIEIPEAAAPSPTFLFDALADTPLPAEEPAAKKVAILTKLWDYLNQVAFEIPIGKRTN